MFGGIRSIGSSVVKRVEDLASNPRVREIGQFAARRVILGDASVPLFQDAARVSLSNEALRKVASVTDIPLVEDIAGVEPSKESAPAQESDSIFQPGAEVSGDFKGGFFSTNNDVGGVYEKIPGGQVNFKVAGFSGYIVPGGKAFAYNAKTGESYSMDIEAADGKYKFSNIQPFADDSFAPKESDVPLIDEATASSVNFRYGKKGLFVAEVFNSNGEVDYSGRGFLDSQGHYLLTLSNGSTIKGDYAVGANGKLQIYSRELVE